MNNVKQCLTVVLALSPLALSAFAQPAPMETPRSDARDARQERRIEQGQQSGALTGNEAQRLEQRQQLMAQREAKMKADGQVSPKERMRLERMNDRESRRIAHQKHDAQHDLNHDGQTDRPLRPRQ